MNIDRFNDINYFIQKPSLDDVMKEVEKPLKKAINMGDEDEITKCFDRCISTFAEGYISCESLEDEQVLIKIEKIKGSFTELSAFINFVKMFFNDISLDLAVEVSRRSMVETANAGFFFQQHGDLISAVKYINTFNSDLFYFQNIIKYCVNLDLLEIKSSFESDHFQGLEQITSIQEIILTDCDRLQKVPTLPEQLVSLTVNNCENLLGVTNVPNLLTGFIFENHDENFRAKFLSSIFNLNKNKAIELFESFEIKTYKSFMEFVSGWKRFNLKSYGILINSLVLKPFPKWLKHYKCSILKDLFITYKNEIPGGEYLRYSLVFKRFMDILPITTSGSFSQKIQFLTFKQEEIAELDDLQQFLFERREETVKKIEKHLNVYPFFVEQEMKKKMFDPEYAKYYQNFFHLYLPLLSSAMSEPFAKKQKINNEYAIDKAVDRTTSALVKMVLLNDNAMFGEENEIQAEQIIYLLQKNQEEERIKLTFGSNKTSRS